MASIGTLILAAGASSRFNGCKALALFNQQPLLQHAINHSNTITGSHCHIVTGAWHEDISHYLAKSHYHGSVIHHRQWQQGIGSSIAFAVQYLDKHYSYDAILILLADQIALCSEDLQRLLQAYTGDNISCAFYHNSPGVPAIFPPHSFKQLQQLSGDRGAKRLLSDDRFDICHVVMPNAAIDIDTRDELLHWQQHDNREEK
ncbi:Bifunctional protein GlmU [Sinobacterium norvegicum]|uniref:Bifunctional protein GlmU n=1 Tax=Sinobacterium norvegicum TaxID=1641715 RepID=A0ABM9AH95_9GAMM|nr:nucleotidyltransferase family protein [Sinobacterium norvegicum]CAH0992125.1 Bifunctional protein GlmU [Sinobacterium norvegicum]